MTRLLRTYLLALGLTGLLLPDMRGSGVYASTNAGFAVGYFGVVGIVRDDAGNPKLAEFGGDGGFVSDLGTMGVGRFIGASIVSAADYRNLQQLLATYRADHDASRDGLAVGATLMTRNQYEIGRAHV